jgi:hypothetical protein
MRHIKLKKIARKQKAIEQAKKNATDQGNSIIYFGLGDYERIDNYLRGLTSDI